MERENWPVGKHGVRPAGSPDHCFYCHTPVGEQHKSDCVIRSKTIVVETLVTHVITVPEHWDEDQVEWHYNNSRCQDNTLQDLQALSERVGCLCSHIKTTVIRDATPEDEARDKLFVADLPS